MRFVVYAAGAVGGVLGGSLALHSHEVLLVCRENHAGAIHEQKGLRLRSATGEYLADVEAVTAVESGRFDEDTCIFFTPKSNHTERCVEALAQAAPRDTPIVSFQNGVSNEEIIAGRFEKVYGGVCRMTCSFLQPGQVSFRGAGRLVIGKYPKGADPFAKKLGKVLEKAGFQVAVSNSILCDKWLKLVVNLQSAFHAIIDTRDHDALEFVDLKVGVLKEADKVLKADKIKARSCDGRDFSIVEIINDLKKPRAPRPASSMKVNNSTWQNLYVRRDEVENGYFHGPIIDLARKYGIAVPYNEVALELTQRCGVEKLGPNTLRAAEVVEEIKRRSTAH